MSPLLSKQTWFESLVGPTRDDFEIWKGVKSIATKLSQVHNRKIYSFILRMIPALVPAHTFHFPPCPASLGAADSGTTSMSMTQNYLNTQQSRHPASAHYLAFWQPFTLLTVFVSKNQSLFPIETRAESSQSVVCGADHRHWQSASSPSQDKARPDQGRWSSRNLSMATLTGGIWRLPVWSVKYWVCRAGIGSRLCRQFVTLELLVKICSEECKACVHAWIWY